MKIDKEKFLFMYEQEAFKPLADKAESGLREILSLMENDKLSSDVRWCGYALATCYHECAGRWQPIEEFDKGKGRPYGKPAGPYGLIYYGRGLVQATWLENYETLTAAWNKEHPARPVDFVKNPELLLVMEYSFWAMSYGMRIGAYTGVGLKKYFNDKVTDPKNARRIINGMDKAELIAGYYDKFERILQECAQTETTATA